MDKAAALVKIAEAIRQCEDCKRNAIGQAVPGEGDPNAAVVFVGEAPGRKEAKTGRPFVAQSGRVLDRLLSTLGLLRSDVYITSPVKYLPKRGTPSLADIIHGRTHLLQQLDVIDPRLVVLMGRVAARAVLGMDVAITREHGRIIQQGGRTYFLTFHPAAVLRNPPLSKGLEADAQKLRDLLSEMHRQQGLV